MDHSKTGRCQEIHSDTLAPTVDHDQGPDSEGALRRIERILDAVKHKMATHYLETAISLLRDVLKDSGSDQEIHRFARWCLLVALTTRFACCEWIDDLEECDTLVDVIDPSHGIPHIREGQEINPSTASVLQALELVAECCHSIDHQMLDTALCIAQEALSSYAWSATTKPPGLPFLFGKTMVLLYLKRREVDTLNRISILFQVSKPLYDTKSPWKYLCLTALRHLAWLQFLDSGKESAFAEIIHYRGLAEDEDKSGKRLCELVTPFMLFHKTSMEHAIQTLLKLSELQPVPHPQRARSITTLAAAFRIRCEQKGDVSDWNKCIPLAREAVMLRPKPHPKHAISLHDLVECLTGRYLSTGDLKDLEEIIDLRREIASMPVTYPPHYLTINKLANALRTRFEHKGDVKDLDECIPLYRESIRLMPKSDGQYAMWINDLAKALWFRYRQKGNFGDLEECVSIGNEALKMAPAGHPDRALNLANMGSTCLTMFEQNGDLLLLERCIKMYSESLHLEPSDSPKYPMALDNLSMALSIRFKQTGNPEDLEQSIALGRDALRTMPRSNPGRSTTLTNLAMILEDRFDQKGDLQDLYESATLYNEAGEITPKFHRKRPQSLSCLANILWKLFIATGNFKDLDNCIILGRESLSLMQQSNPYRAISLHNISNALRTRFMVRGNILDLKEAIALDKEALELRPLPHPKRVITLNNLAASYSLQFMHYDNIEDLEKSIALGRDALVLSPAPLPARLGLLSQLAGWLLVRSTRKGTHEDIKQAFLLYKEAAEYPTGSILQRLYVSQVWASNARIHCPNMALDAFQCAIDIFPLLASLDLTLSQRQSVLTYAKDIIGDAARCAIEQNRFETAVVFLATGRYVFWSQALQLRTPVDKLAAINPDLASRVRTISQKLEEASHQPREAVLRKNSDEIGTTSIYGLVKAWNQTVNEVRKIKGFEEFLQPPKFLPLEKATRGRIIVLLNSSKRGCDALIVQGGSSIHRVSLSISLIELEQLQLAAQALAQGDCISSEVMQKFADIHGDNHPTVNTEGLSHRDLFRMKGTATSEEDGLSIILKILWLTTVEPVVRHLGLKKSSDAPTRIWWCPTGPFVFLPVHAAGIYSQDGNGDCLSDYAISSYCSSPQDLVSSNSAIPKDFKMLAVIEPDAGGGAPLPGCYEELQKIEDRIPDTGLLIAHVGSCDSPTSTDKVLTDIRRASFVHFGCHGIQHPTSPLESFLLLSGGKLTMSRIMRECQTPGAALAYLSACETAKGDDQRPDESLNLAATMMFAGFQGVVGTMWSIPDSDAPIVADIFYSHIFRQGLMGSPRIEDAAYGLHLATNELRRRGKPFKDWVPFVHYGI